MALPSADTAWLPPRDHLCSLCHHQINQFLYILSGVKNSFSNFLFFYELMEELRFEFMFTVSVQGMMQNDEGGDGAVVANLVPSCQLCDLHLHEC